MDYILDNPFRTTYASCCQISSFVWECKFDFNSMNDADTFSVLQRNKYKSQTTLIPINYIWPRIIKKKIVSIKLKPHIRENQH